MQDNSTAKSLAFVAGKLNSRDFFIELDQTFVQKP